MKEIAVIGGGAAGISAALALKAAGKNFIWISERSEKSRQGRIYDYPAMPDVTYAQLEWAFLNHCERMGIRLKVGRVDAVYESGGKFTLSIGEESVEADAVILCTGESPKTPPSELLHGLRTENGKIRTERDFSTNVTGVFAAGGCASVCGVTQAVGEGNAAARSAAEYTEGRLNAERF